MFLFYKLLFGHFILLFSKFYLFIYFWPPWVLFASHGLFLVVASRGSSLVGVCGLLTAMVPFIVEHGL